MCWRTQFQIICGDGFYWNLHIIDGILMTQSHQEFTHSAKKSDAACVNLAKPQSAGVIWAFFHQMIGLKLLIGVQAQKFKDVVSAP